VLRWNGVVVVAAISRFASALDGLVRHFFSDPRYAAITWQGLADGQHRGTEDAFFTTTCLNAPPKSMSAATTRTRPRSWVSCITARKRRCRVRGRPVHRATTRRASFADRPFAAARLITQPTKDSPSSGNSLAPVVGAPPLDSLVMFAR
jgi:hypothetical protein